MKFRHDGDGGRVKKSTVHSQQSIETTYIGSLFEIEQGLRKHIFCGANRIATVSSSLEGSASSILKRRLLLKKRKGVGTLNLPIYKRGTDGDLSLSSLRGSASAIPKVASISEAISYYHGDHLGSSNIITDETGTQVQLLEYTPYGEVWVWKSEGTDAVSHKFTGKELDSTGLYFYGARYYDPAIARFITADPTIQHPYDPQDLNRYAYCRNNPINLADPSGLGWKSFWNKVGDFFSGIGQGISANPGAFVAGLAVGIFAAWAIAPMISGLHSAMLASGAGVTFWEGFVLGGMEMGIPAFTGSLAGGLSGGEKFSTALKNASVVGAGTFVTAGLIEGAYTEGWQNWVHFQDTQASNQLYGQAKDALKTGKFNAYSDFAGQLMDMNLTPPGAVLHGKSPIPFTGGVKHSYLVAAKNAQVKAMGFDAIPEMKAAAISMRIAVPGVVRAETAATLSSSTFDVLTWNLTKVTSVWGNMDKITMPLYELGSSTRNCYGWTNAVLRESGLPLIDARDVW